MINEIIPVRGHREMRFWRAMRGALVLAGLGYAPAAHAVLLQAGNSLTISSGGASVTLTVASCTIANGTSNNSCNGSQQIVQNGSYLGILVEPVSPATELTSWSKSASGDMTLDLDITSTVSLTGFDIANVIGAGNHTTVGAAPIQSGAFTSGNAGIGSSYGATFNPIYSLDETLDIQPLNLPETSPAYVTSFTQNFAAPEPAAFSLFVVGTVVMAFLRRRRC